MHSKNYNRAKLNIDFLKVRQLEELKTLRPFFDLSILYVITFSLVFASVYIFKNFSYWIYPIAIFFIAGRQGAFLQLIHEASHNLINKNVKINDFYGSWLTSYFVGVNFRGYREGHNSHHANTATEFEPKSDSEKYRIIDFKNPKIYFLFLKDLIGLTALQIFFDYGGENKNDVNKKSKNLKKIKFILQMSIVQLIILSLFKFNIINYILFWLYPAMGPHMFLMRIRGIAEHGLNKQLGRKVINSKEGLYYTRSFLTNKNSYKFFLTNFLEKSLIGSFYVYYHHEHHLNSKIPYYNLKEFHNLVYDEVMKNREQIKNFPMYEKGYFSATFKTSYVPEHIVS